MVRVKVIERRLPHGWEVLLEVNGVIGRAEDLLCLEEIPSQRPSPTSPAKPEKVQILHPWLRNPERFIDVTGPAVRFVSFAEK